MTNDQKAIIALTRRIASLERDLKFTKTLLFPNQRAVYRAAMRYYKRWITDGTINSSELRNACTRAAKVKK